MRFEVNEIIYTGWEERLNKDNKPYTLVKFLDPDTGDSFSCMTKVTISPMLKQLDKVRANFEVIAGRYTSLKLISIEKI